MVWSYVRVGIRLRVWQISLNPTHWGWDGSWWWFWACPLVGSIVKFCLDFLISFPLLSYNFIDCQLVIKFIINKYICKIPKPTPTTPTTTPRNISLPPGDQSGPSPTPPSTATAALAITKVPRMSHMDNYKLYWKMFKHSKTKPHNRSKNSPLKTKNYKPKSPGFKN